MSCKLIMNQQPRVTHRLGFTNIIFIFQEEAIKWKERGNFLFKEKKLDVLVEYYSLAISYTPINSQDLLSQLLCNRSLAHIKNGTFKLALTDAKHCIKLRPEWSKVSISHTLPAEENIDLLMVCI